MQNTVVILKVLGSNDVLNPYLKYFSVRNNALKVFDGIWGTQGFFCICWKEAPPEVNLNLSLLAMQWNKIPESGPKCRCSLTICVLNLVTVLYLLLKLLLRDSNNNFLNSVFSQPVWIWISAKGMILQTFMWRFYHFNFIYHFSFVTWKG